MIKKKNPQQIQNRGELPQRVKKKKYLQKPPQLTLNLMVKD